MCTVTFLPISKTDFVLTSNRDEQTLRMPAMQPLLYQVHQSLVVFPKDRQAEGTWIATSGIPFTLCLLNGAFHKHERKIKYSKSRGLVLLDFFKYNDVNNFLSEYDFNDIEPFTLLLLDTSVDLKLTEARWDGLMMHRKEVDTNKPHIWSSATLYSSETIKEREQWFIDFLAEHRDYSAAGILDFHHFGGRGDQENSLLMNRQNKVRTVSITSIRKEEQTTYMTYKDVISEKVYSRRIC